MSTDDVVIPPPLPQVPPAPLAVGRYGASHVEAEDFSRKLGNWGNASRLIGDRWEACAPDLLRRRLPWSLPLGGGRLMTIVAVLALDADPESGATLQRAGVSAPDLLLVGRMGAGAGGKPVLRAADCKVSLDTAEREQTAPGRLQKTIGRIKAGYGRVADALRRQVAQAPAADRRFVAEAIEAALADDWNALVAGEGLFVAPDNGFNRWFLGQLETRRRTGVPLGRLPTSGPRRAASEVRGPVNPAVAVRLELPAHLEPITAEAFLGGLPGWPEAGFVAALDRVALEAVDLAVAERSWRAGAGLRGAILALRRALFHALDDRAGAGGRPRDVTSTLRRIVRRTYARDSAGLISAIAHLVARRRPLWDREAALLRPPVSYTQWVLWLAQSQVGNEASPDEQVENEEPAVGARFIAPAGGDADAQPSTPSLPSSLSPRALYKEMSARHRRRVLAAAAGRASEAGDEEALLRELEAKVEEWREASRADAADFAGSLQAVGQTKDE
ncbi:MAG: hypothetical protein HY332_10480 [Chloroflexi bacterium]|nr:hypothetical protein [Chloroflexota bacterium]